MLNVSERVEQVLEDCNNGKLELVSNRKGSQPILYNQKEILRRIDFYINNKYLERDDDALFWNISNHRITHFAKLISPDTKDFLPYGLGSLNFWQGWALRKQVTKWFKDNSFYKTLNDVAEGLSTYGSCVWKKYKENGRVMVKEVRLQNLYFDQSVENIQDADIVEIHNLSEKELWDKDGIWDNVQDVIKKKKNGRYEVWEYYGQYSKEEGKKPEYRHVIGYGFGSDFVQLWDELVDRKDCPYKDFHLGRYRGRWLRMGVVERLFKLQERTNQLVNQNAQTTEIASLLLLKSANADISGNVLEQAVNGQIIGDETLQQIGITNTGLSQFIQELQLINQQADKLCLTPEIVQGESSPSNTTFRGIATVNAGAVSAFRNYKQDLFEKIAEILIQDIFPLEVKKWSREKTLEMAEDDQDIEKYDEIVKRKMSNTAKMDMLLEGATAVTQEASAQIDQMTNDKFNQDVKTVGRKIVPDENFFNFKWGFKMVPTDESVDKSAQNDAYYNALQMAGANPALVDIPLFKQYLENNGISWWKLTPEQKEALTAQASGGMPEPKQPDQLLASAMPIK